MTALAVAMGIGRFAFTPILPMMQHDVALSLGDGSWLASINYFGFLLGAISAIRLRVPHTVLIRGGLLVIGVVTLLMGFTSQFAAWIVLRALAGVANALTQVFAFAWCLNKLSAAQRPVLNGVVCAGVGTGIVAAGGFCLVVMQIGASSAQAWIGLGTTALIATAAVWRIFSGDDYALSRDSQESAWRCPRWNTDALRLVFCFGASGLGYIVPATFLPVMAWQRVSNPLVFGWAWPVFGVAAAISPLLAAGWSRLIGNRRVWILSHCVMAFGVALPVFSPAISSIMIAAFLIGATFMINALASMQEAQVVAGREGAAGLMAAMITGFGTGQIAGPLLLSYLIGPAFDFSLPLLIAAGALIASAYALAASDRARSR
jgi:MFS family permease